MSRWTAEREFRPIGLGTRAINALSVQGVDTLCELQSLTQRELERFPGIGPGTIKHLSLYLRAEGHTFEIHRRSRLVTIRLDPAALTALDALAYKNGVTRNRAARDLIMRGIAP